MREAWTDERLDDLANRMDRGFDRAQADVCDLRSDMDHRFERVDTEFRELRNEMNTRFDAVDRRFGAVDARFDSLHRTMILGFAGIVASVIGTGILTSL